MLKRFSFIVMLPLWISVAHAISPSYDVLNVRRVLNQLVHDNGSSKTNTFCLIDQIDHAGNDQTWVYWPEGNAIILWEPSVGPVTKLAWSRRYLHIPDDFVSDEYSLHGSTYLETKRWLNKLVDECRSNGEIFLIKE